MKLHFITFGNEPWHKSVQTLCNEARELGIFSSVRGFTETDLDSDILSYCNANPKGFGHWIWKPVICSKVLEDASEDDIFLYCDAGCVFNPPAVNRIFEYTTMIRDTGIVCFQMPPHIEVQWTKRELFRRLGCEHRRDIVDSPQIEATSFLFTKRASQLINTWRFLATENKLNINSDITIPQDVRFREHRWDQSILSLIIKLSGGTILGWETWCWGDHPSEYAMNPIWEMRRKL